MARSPKTGMRRTSVYRRGALLGATSGNMWPPISDRMLQRIRSEAYVQHPLLRGKGPSQEPKPTLPFTASMLFILRVATMRNSMNSKTNGAVAERALAYETKSNQPPPEPTTNKNQNKMPHTPVFKLKSCQWRDWHCPELNCSKIITALDQGLSVPSAKANKPATLY